MELMEALRPQDETLGGLEWRIGMLQMDSKKRTTADRGVFFPVFSCFSLPGSHFLSCDCWWGSHLSGPWVPGERSCSSSGDGDEDTLLDVMQARWTL